MACSFKHMRLVQMVMYCSITLDGLHDLQTWRCGSLRVNLFNLRHTDAPLIKYENELEGPYKTWCLAFREFITSKAERGRTKCRRDTYVPRPVVYVTELFSGEPPLCV